MITDIAEEVRSIIEAAEIEGIDSVERRWILRVDQRELGTEVLVIVHPGNSNEELSAQTRAAVGVDHTIEIGLAAKLASDDPAERETELDAFAAIAEKVRDLFHIRIMPIEGVMWKKSDHDPVTDEEFLQTCGCFFSLIMVTYTEYRQRIQNPV